MDPIINIIVAINLFVSMSANLSGAKKGIKASLSNVEKKPKTYLQKVPPNVAAIVFIATILAIFNLGVFSDEIKNEYFELRIIGLVLFVLFSWVQVFSFKSLGEFYSQDILIFKKHKLKMDGPYSFLRHPQYVSQLLSDLGAAIALMGFILIPLVVLVQIPLFILRAKAEDNLLQNHFKEDFITYKKKSGFFIPFIG